MDWIIKWRYKWDQIESTKLSAIFWSYWSLLTWKSLRRLKIGGCLYTHLILVSEMEITSKLTFADLIRYSKSSKNLGKTKYCSEREIRIFIKILKLWIWFMPWYCELILTSRPRFNQKGKTPFLINGRLPNLNRAIPSLGYSFIC